MIEQENKTFAKEPKQISNILVDANVAPRLVTIEKIIGFSQMFAKSFSCFSAICCEITCKWPFFAAVGVFFYLLA